MEDEPIHKLVCKKFARRSGLLRFDEAWVMYFPVDSTEPEFTKLLFTCTRPQWNGATPFRGSSLMVNGCSSTCPCKFNTHDIRFISSSVHNSLCRYIHIVAPEREDNASVHDTEDMVNKCIKTLTGDTSWKGPVIVYAKIPKGKPVDMGTSFFSRTLSAFSDVVGVRINCDVAVKRLNAPQFEAVAIKSYDLRGTIDDRSWNLARGHHNAAFLTQHTGTVLQDRPESHAEDPSHSGLHRRNSTSRLLSIPCDISEQNFGFYSRPHDTGNVIVVREDRKPLEVDRGRLTDEDTEDKKDEEMADIVENEDTTDDEMPEDGEEFDDSDVDDDIFDDESSDVQDGDNAE
ncbi:hypothetical protein KCU62_g2415, partial [Aureobasidium sp. EXF-3399]